MAQKMRIRRRLIAAFGIIAPLVTADLVWNKEPSIFLRYSHKENWLLSLCYFLSDGRRTARIATCVATKTKEPKSKIIKNRTCNIFCLYPGLLLRTVYFFGIALFGWRLKYPHVSKFYLTNENNFRRASELIRESTIIRDNARCGCSWTKTRRTIR